MGPASKLMNVGITIFGKLDPSFSRTMRAAQTSVGNFGDKMRRDVNSAIAGPQHQMRRFFGSELHHGLTHAALGATAALGGSILAARNYRMELFNVALITEATTEQTEAMHRRISDASAWNRTNQSVVDLAKGMRVLVTEGYTLQEAMGSIEAIGKVATATGSQISDISRLTFQLTRTFKIGADDLESTFDGLLFAGKQGAFELRDMAEHFPELLAAAGTRLGATGRESALSLAAMAQVVRTSFSDSSQAATALTNAVQEFMKPVFLDRVQKRYGVDFEAVLVNAKLEGRDPVMAAFEKLQELTGGDPFRIGELVVRKEAQQAMAVLLNNWGQFLTLREKTFKAEGLIATDFIKQIDSYPGVLKAWKNQTLEFFAAMGYALFPALKGLLVIFTPILQGIVDFAEVAPWAATGAALLLAGFAGIILLGPGIVATIQLFTIAAKLLTGLKIGAWLAGSLGGVPGLAAGLAKLKGALLVFKAGGILAGIKALGVAFAGLLGPVGWTVLAVVGLGAALVALYQRHEGFRSAVDRTWAGLVKWTGKAWGAVQAFAVRYFKALGEWAGHAWQWLQGLGKILGGLLTGDGAMLLEGWRQLTTAMQEGWAWLFKTLGESWQDLLIGLNRVLPGLGSMLEGWTKIVAGLWFGDIEKMAAGWKMLQQGWQRIAPRISRALQSWLNDRIEDFKSKGLQMGRSFGLSFLEGMGGPLARAGINAVRAMDEARRRANPRNLPLSAATLPPGTYPEGISRPGTPPRALGGPVIGGLSYLVGERRPEVLEIPTRGTARIWPSVPDWERSRSQAPGATLALPELPALQLGALPALALPELPELPALQLGALPALALPELPELPALQLGALPALALPELPELGVAEPSPLVPPELPGLPEQTLLRPPAAPSRTMTLNVAPGAVQVTVQGDGAASPERVRQAVAEALEQFRLDLESSTRSLLND
ncbi:MAG: phage tail tape measure protein [Cyanobacteria bacterium J06638_7]